MPETTQLMQITTIPFYFDKISSFYKFLTLSQLLIVLFEGGTPRNDILERHVRTSSDSIHLESKQTKKTKVQNVAKIIDSFVGRINNSK